MPKITDTTLLRRRAESIINTTVINYVGPDCSQNQIEIRLKADKAQHFYLQYNQQLNLILFDGIIMVKRMCSALILKAFTGF